MKVTRRNPDQLILDYAPWLIGVLLGAFTLIFLGAGALITLSGDLTGLAIGGLGGGIGFAVFAAFLERVQLILERPANRITLRHRSLFGYSEIIHDLSDLERAILERKRGSKGATLYRPSLVLTGMSEGIHPIISSYTNTQGPARAVRAVNDWLEGLVQNRV